MFANVYFPEGRDIREDAAIMPQILLNCKCVKRISDVYYHYRYVPSSIMHKSKYTDEELAGCRMNDFYRIDILWSNLPDKRKDLAVQFMQLFERTVCQRQCLTYFGLDRILLSFLRQNHEHLLDLCTDAYHLYLIKSAMSFDIGENIYDIYEGIYNSYTWFCFRPKRSFSYFRLMRLMKYRFSNIKGKP